MPLVPDVKNCDISVKKAIQGISKKLGYTASPTFVGASLGTGELTCGSINRASGTLTLEIGGTAEVSISSTTITLGGNLVIPNAGYIGSVSDTDAIQIEADGDILLSQKLGIGITPTYPLHISNICTLAAGKSFLRVTGLQTDATALTGTLRGAYIDVSNGSTAATGTIRGMELKARTEAPGDTGNNVAVLEGLSISADSKDHSVTTMRAAEFILDGSTGGTITEAVGLRIANNLQANKATTSYGLQIYRDSFDYTYDIQLSNGGLIAGTGIITIPSFTQGSVPFIGSGGILSQNNSNLFWDTTNNRLGIGINSGFFPATGLTVFGEMDLIHTSNETDDHAFEIDVDAAGYGDVKAVDIDYTTGDISKGKDEAVILVNVDEIEATGGDVFGLEILATEGAAGSTTTVYGLKAGALVGPIHQDSGTFLNPGIGTNDTPQTPVANMIDGDSSNTTSIFVAFDDYIIIGKDAVFEEIEFIITTGSSGAGIKPKFEYSTGGSGFTEFFPVDGTNGFRNTGVVAWDAGDLTSHAVNNATGLSDTYDIRITRKRTNLTTPPVLGYAKTAATTEYIWDKSGNVNIKTLTISTIAAEGSDVDKFLVDSSGVIKYRTGTEVLSDIGGQASGSYITALTGEVTASGPGSVAATIANDAVTYAKMQNVSATDKVLGRVTAGAGDVEEITCTAAGRAILDDADASTQRTTLGLVIGTNVQAYGAVLDDLNTLGAVGADSEFLVGTAAGALTWESGATARTSLGLTIGTNVQAYDAGLTSLAGLIYASDSFIKVTATDTYAIRTIAETKTDLSLNNVSNVATDDTAYNTTSWNANSDAATKNAIRDKVETMDTAIGSNTTHRGLTSGNPHGVTPTELSLVIGTNTQAFSAALDDLTNVGTVTGDSYFLVGTGAGTLAWETTTTVRTSLGLGAGNSPTFAAANIGTGELTCGSINRASGNLTLEIGGTVELSISSTTTTFGGHIVMPDGASFGAIGTGIIFDDTNNQIEFSASGGCTVGINTSAPLAQLQIGVPSGAIGNTPLVRFIGSDLSAASETILRFLRTNDGAGHYYTGGVDFNMYSYGAGGAGEGYAPDTQLDIVLKATQNDTDTADVTVISMRDDGTVGVGVTAPTGKLHVDQASASGAMPVLRLDQGDIDDSFIDFIGTSAADGTRSISSDTGELGACFGKFRVEINGVVKWVRVYDDES